MTSKDYKHQIEFLGELKKLMQKFDIMEFSTYCAENGLLTIDIESKHPKIEDICFNEKDGGLTPRTIEIKQDALLMTLLGKDRWKKKK